MDKRKKSYKKYKEIKEILLSKECLCAVILGAIIGLSLGTYYWKSCQPKLLTPLVKPEAVKVVQEVQAAGTPFCYDAITCIRDVGEELGRDNQTIITMIKIAKKESGLNPRAKNKHSSASGLFQITADTWYSNDCVGDKWIAEDNTRCAYKIQGKRGYQPWEVWNKGLIK